MGVGSGEAREVLDRDENEAMETFTHQILNENRVPNLFSMAMKKRSREKNKLISYSIPSHSPPQTEQWTTLKNTFGSRRESHQNRSLVASTNSDMTQRTQKSVFYGGRNSTDLNNSVLERERLVVPLKPKLLNKLNAVRIASNK